MLNLYDILTVAYKAFTILECGHIYHRVCIEKKIINTVPSTCPFLGCGKSIDIVDEGSRRDSVSSQLSGTSTLVGEFTRNIEITSRISSQGQAMNLDENEETEHRHEPAEDQVEESSDSTSKKRTNEATDKSTEKFSSKKTKKEIKAEDSIVLKRLIRELSFDTTRISEIREKKGLHRESTQEVEGSRFFFDLYLKISKAEEQNKNTHHEVIRSYYNFGDELEKRLAQYREANEEHDALKKLYDEVRDQLPKEVTKNALRKKADRARKIFFRITDDKIQRVVFIQRIKTFSATSISNLSSDNIKYVASHVRKNTQV
ncbi:11653_t:CDS:1 [Ambispora leptoticha]|uniref:11653_t:CDS:1 n=1 Tax=Ambispora leptoticha TaxID=144679 RepID=A0A9N9HND4_9GLOM|nr:11653_t:CDS:1 [Ambispora leptoticha]